MSFLAGLGAKLFELLLGDFVAWAGKTYAARKARKAIQDAANQSVKKLEDAKTGDEIDAAANDSLDHF